MRYPAILAATALVSSTILSTPAYAVDISPDATVEPDQVMFQGYCDDHYVTDDLHYVEAIAGSVVAGTATEVPNSRQDLEETRVGDPSSTITYSGLLGVGGPLVRIGGSPNLFATGTYSTKNYSGSFVDQTALFSHRDAYNFDCRYWTDTVTTTTDPGGSDPNNPGVGNCVGDPNKKDAIDGVGPGRARRTQTRTAPALRAVSSTTMTGTMWITPTPSTSRPRPKAKPSFTSASLTCRFRK